MMAQFRSFAHDGGKLSRDRAASRLDGQRFDIFLVSPKGRVYAAWLDKRDAAAAKLAGEPSRQRIAVGWSDDGAKSFAAKILMIIPANVRVSAALAPTAAVFAWRQVYDTSARPLAL